jgi:opacity protein-like surface antigen
MSLFVRTPIAAACVLASTLSAAPARAQTPDTGMVAVSGEFGFFLPNDDFDTTLTLAGAFEYYLTPRFGLRTKLGWADPTFSFDDDDDSLRQTRLTFEALYNWEGGAWHPYIGAGAGVYFLQLTDSGDAVGDGDATPGFVATGGVEYFTSNTWSLKGELQYHVIDRGDFTWSPSGLSVTFGVKKYFR